MQSTYTEELIGEEIEVISSKNKSEIGIKGKIVDETKMTLKIQCVQNVQKQETRNSEIKILLKNNIIFKLVKNGQILNGETLTKKPEDRLK